MRFLKFAQKILIVGLMACAWPSAISWAQCPSCEFYRARMHCGTAPAAPYPNECHAYCVTVTNPANLGTACSSYPPPATAGVSAEPWGLTVNPTDCIFPEAIVVDIKVRQARYLSGPQAGQAVEIRKGQKFQLEETTRRLIVPAKSITGRDAVNE